MDDTLDVYQATNREQEVDVKELVSASRPTHGSAKDDELDLSEVGAFALLNTNFERLLQMMTFRSLVSRPSLVLHRPRPGDVA